MLRNQEYRIGVVRPVSETGFNFENPVVVYFEFLQEFECCVDLYEKKQTVAMMCYAETILNELGNVLGIDNMEQALVWGDTTIKSYEQTNQCTVSLFRDCMNLKDWIALCDWATSK